MYYSGRFLKKKKKILDITVIIRPLPENVLEFIDD